MNENLFLKGFENGVSGKKINAKEIKNIRFSKANSLFSGKQKAEIPVTSAETGIK